MKHALTPSQIHILRHSLGLTRAKEPYRNYYCAGPHHHCIEDIKVLMKLGLMDEFKRNPGIWLDNLYYVTEEGKRWLKEAR